MLLHVSVLLRHLQGTLILCLLKLKNTKIIKITKEVGRCMAKSVLLTKCGNGNIDFTLQ
jgi:hypothetical protein